MTLISDDGDTSDDDTVLDDTLISDDDEDEGLDLDVSGNLSTDTGDEIDLDISDIVEAIFCRTKGGRMATTCGASLFK